VVSIILLDISVGFKFQQNNLMFLPNEVNLLLQVRENGNYLSMAGRLKTGRLHLLNASLRLIPIFTKPVSYISQKVDNTQRVA